MAFSNNRNLIADSIVGINTVKNYASQLNDFENGSSAFIGYLDGTTRPTGVFGGSTSTLSKSISSSNPLKNAFSLRLTKTAACQGQGFYFNFTPTRSDRLSGSVLKIRFKIELLTGTFTGSSDPVTDSTLIVGIWDTVNNVNIEPSTRLIQQMVIGLSYEYNSEFQIPTNATNLRFYLHHARAGSGPFELAIDDLEISRSPLTTGVPGTDWVTYPLTIGGSTTAPTLGTTTVNIAKWRRLGDSMEISYSLVQTSAGTAGSGYYKFPLPAGYTADSNKILIGNNNVVNVGVVGVYNGSTIATGAVQLIDSTNLILTVGATTQPTAQVASSFYGLNGTTAQYGFTATVPITGWTSSVRMSDGFENAIIAARVIRNSNQTINTTATDIIWDLVGSDETNSYNTANGEYTIPSSGYYEFTSNLRLDTGALVPGQVIFEYVIDGSGVIAGAPTDFVANKAYFFNPQYLTKFTAGQKVKLRITSATNASTLIGSQNAWFVKKISDPRSIGVSEFKWPTIQKFISGSGSYTTPQGVKYLKVRMVGGGGGGSGGGLASWGAGGNGTNSTFGTSLLQANGGSGGPTPFGSGGAGGSAALNSPGIGSLFFGASGMGGSLSTTGGSGVPCDGGYGGASFFGGNGAGGNYVATGGSAQTNTGSGGGGGASGNNGGTIYGGNGGGAGGFVDAIINQPFTINNGVFAYTVGTGGSAGAAGTGANAAAGGAGAAGYIEVTEFYQ